MNQPATFSERTRCPICLSRIRLEDVRFTPKFSCPFCGADICVSGDKFKRVIPWLAWPSGLAVAYVIFSKWWLTLALWIPFTWCIGGGMTFIWVYVGKYFFPPKLEKCVTKSPVDPTSPLGIYHH